MQEAGKVLHGWRDEQRALRFAMTWIKQAVLIDVLRLLTHSAFVGEFYTRLVGISQAVENYG
jgi:hypothetical protein